jgi:hypothetical protein
VVTVVSVIFVRAVYLRVVSSTLGSGLGLVSGLRRGMRLRSGVIREGERGKVERPEVGLELGLD